MICLAAMLTIPALSQAEESDSATVQPMWTGPWVPPEPNRAGWDWVRLKSNEWVKGEILLMRDFDLEFDSDEFGIVTLDWNDVLEVRTERVYTLVLRNLETSYTGTIAIRGDKISVNVGDAVIAFNRSRLLAITPSDEQELNLWSIHASLGLGLRFGNTDQAEYTGRMRLDREAKTTQFNVEYNGVYGSLNNQKNTNNHRARSKFNFLLTQDLFLTPISFEAFTDEFQNISYRLTPTVGAGYYLFRKPTLEWNIWAGGGYQYTRLDSAIPGDSKTSDNGAIVLSTSVDADLTSRVDLILEYQLQVIAPDIDLTNHHTEVTFEVELSSALDLDVSFIWDRIENPETESGGKTPKRNDFRLSVGLAVDF